MARISCSNLLSALIEQVAVLHHMESHLVADTRILKESRKGTRTDAFRGGDGRTDMAVRKHVTVRQARHESGGLSKTVTRSVRGNMTTFPGCLI